MVIMRQADTVDNEKQEPAALQLSSCPVHLEYIISKNRLAGHHTEEDYKAVRHSLVED